MKTHVEFKAKKFTSNDIETGEVNPDIWCKRLAEFLQKNLKKHGIKTDAPYSTAWGWRIPVVNEQFPISIICEIYEEYDDGFLVYLDPNKPFIRKWFKKIDTTADLGRVAEAIDEILHNDNTTKDIHWWTDDESAP